MLRRAVELTWCAASAVMGCAASVAAEAAELVGDRISGVTSRVDNRVHVRVRGVHTGEVEVVRRVEQLLVRHPAVRRAEVNAVLGHVMVEADPERLPARAVGELVRRVELRCGLADAGYAEASAEHPGAAAPALRESVLLGLHTAGLAYTTVGRVLPGPLGGLPASVVAFVDAVPRLRSAVAMVLGNSTTDVLLSSAAAAANAAARRPLGLIADAGQRLALAREAQARRGAWRAWEAALARQPGAHAAQPVPVGSRPRRLPGGPVEKVAERSGLVTAGAAALLVGIRGRNLVDLALAAGVPKAARAGREGFAAYLGRDLAGRGSLVLDRSVMRRLDRVDTVVLDTDVVCTGQQTVDEVVPLVPDLGLGELVERVHDLVDPHQPRTRRAEGGWSVAPYDAQDTVLGEAARSAYTGLRAMSGVILVLRRDTAPVALVGVGAALDPFAEALVAAARTGAQVLVNGPVELARRLGADRLDGASDLVSAVRGLQSEGRVVALVSKHDPRALAVADVGIAALRSRQAPPWSADVVTSSAGELTVLLSSLRLARQVSRHCAQLAVAGSMAGALFGALGPTIGAAARASLAVHTAALLALGWGTWSGMAAARCPDPIPTDRTPWHAMSGRAVLELLNSSPTGLSQRESLRRRRERPTTTGPQDLGLARATVEELANPLTPTLAAGAGVSAATGSVLDPLLILFVLMMNGLIGGAQRRGADRALHALRRTSAAAVQVRRPDTEADQRGDELVEGDVIVLRAGDAVPADCRVLSSHDLELDESSLTGESVPVAKSAQPSHAQAVADRHSMLYEGTVVATGRVEAVVVATGGGTEVGRTMRANGEHAPPTGVEIRLRELTTRILPISIGAGVALVAVDLLRRRPWGTALSRAVSLAVAAVPEGLPFVATVAELAAARRLSGRGALVRNPSTIEALGRVNILCFDKTGTLTEGRISLRRVSDGLTTSTVDQPLNPALQHVVATAVRASPFRAATQDVTHQTDRAVLAGARELGISPDHEEHHIDQVDELPFESFRGYHATLWRNGEEAHRISVKGAPEVVLPLCSRWAGRSAAFDHQARRAIDAEVHRLAGHGHRVLAVAERSVSNRRELSDDDVSDLEFRGLLALVDPVRPAAARAVATLRKAGVRVAMITGDHPSTAEAIAAELDALNGRRVLSGTELDELDDEQLTATLPKVAVFARVSPAQKARIVQLLQRSGAAVAVTGDGANDAPAIRLADVGIALGARATPAAREAADVVVTDDRIETITEAIVEGRAMWTSVRDALSILLGGNLGEIAYTLGTGLLNGGAALNARQLLLINLLTDVLPAMAVAVRPPADTTADQLLAEGPEGSLGTSLTRDIQLRAAITAAAAALSWLAARPVSTPGQASTSGLVALVGAQLGQTLAVRGRTPLVAAAVVGSFVVLAAAVQTPGISHIVGSRPLLPHQWAIALAAASAATIVQVAAQRRAQASGQRLARRPPASPPSAG